MVFQVDRRSPNHRNCPSRHDERQSGHEAASRYLGDPRRVERDRRGVVGTTDHSSSQSVAPGTEVVECETRTKSSTASQDNC